MPFVRRKRGQVLLVHSERRDDRITQRVLHRFTSPAELESILEPRQWKEWAAMIEWRHSGLTWDWDQLRARLLNELEHWREKPSATAERRQAQVLRLATELTRALRSLSAARPSDARLLTDVRVPLALLAEAIVRALAPPPTTPNTPEEQPMRTREFPHLEYDESESDRVFDDGMEFWWVGNRTAAARLFRQALKLDPLHADAHNHLGIHSLGRGRLKDAERHFELAIEGGARSLERDGNHIPWGFIENRPYLRGLANLALVHRRRKKHESALEIHERLLKLNPNDNQGIRWLLGEDYHRLGRLSDAIEAYGNSLEEPGCCFGLALALHESGKDDEVGRALLRGFARNRYVAPMLLGEPWELLDGFHGTNMAEPEWAGDYLDQQQGLWRKSRRSAEVLRFWWLAKPVTAWREELDELIVELKELPPLSDKRSEALHRQSFLTSDDNLASLAERVGAMA